jgi:hypothetical protein
MEHFVSLLIEPRLIALKRRYGAMEITKKGFKMRYGFIHHVSIIRPAALALLALCLLKPQVRAQEQVSLVFHTISWGMVSGQRVAFNVFNTNEPSEQERGTVFVQVTLLDARGAAVARSDEIAIPPGAFRSVYFKREDLSVAGERAQTHARVRYRTFSIVDRSKVIGFPTSIELIDDAAGRATLLVSETPKAIGAANPALTELSAIVYSGRSLIGLPYGWTLRVNAVYPGDPADPQRQPVRARVRLYDANGSLLKQSADATIAPGGLLSFDIDRADIHAPGEPIGGRLQMLVSLEASATGPPSFTQDPKASGLLATSLELIDNSTGRTAAVWLTVGFFEVVPAPNPQ